MVKVLENVITRPILAKSKERNIPLWLTLPCIGCTATGVALLFSPSSILKLGAELSKSWPGVVYLVAGGLYFIAGKAICFLFSIFLFVSLTKIGRRHSLQSGLGLLHCTICYTQHPRQAHQELHGLSLSGCNGTDDAFSW